MQVVKVINNNLVHSVDASGNDCIVMGRGLGFGAHIQDTIDSSKIEKVYTLIDPNQSSRFTQLIKDIPLNHLQIANMIIDYAMATLNKPLGDNIYFALFDHIDFALQRLEKGLMLKNKLLYEIKMVYPSEFQVATEALSMVKSHLGVDFPLDEAGYIAIHLVEAEVGVNKTTNYVQDAMNMIQGIMNIIKYHFSIDFDVNSLAYQRMLIHLRFFADRMLQGKDDVITEPMLIKAMKDSFAKEYACAEKIKIYIETNFHFHVGEDECVYLCVHIHRVLNDGTLNTHHFNR